MFKKVSSQINFPQMEEEIMSFWKQEEVFEKSMEARKDAKHYVFYEGPPTANGKPHIGHAMPRSMKDLFPRYKTMDGYFVYRKAGWDTHGLPVELEVEKMLGISGKHDIENYGMEDFIKKCKESVFKYEKEWERLTERIGFWLDLENAYVTYTNDYIESIWWSLRKAWDKDLLYKGFKVLPYCPRCGTSLSSHEVAQGYKEVEDPSVFVRFPIIGEEKTYFLVWTTTPWTLPSNVALAVGEDIDYVMVEHHGEYLILAKGCLGVLHGDYSEVKTIKGKELIGKKYKPPYNLKSIDKEAHYVVEGDFVSTEDGTGIVHMAPSFGEDDARMAQKFNLPAPNPVDAAGAFTGDVKEWEGKFVKDADEHIIEYLKENNILYKSELYLHNYPFCWRCDTPLLYYARDSWFIRMTAVKEKLLENNQKINWFPEHIKDGRFGNFLDNVIDWALSRERYWGTPLNIWTCECGHKHCIGSIEELKEMAVNMPKKLDLHRPYVDDILLNCPKCVGKMKRASEVIDCWYDSGSMPFAQWHYPFENKKRFEESFPADFICEAIDQTRGWFYTLLAISTFVFEEPPYKNCVVTEFGLDESGQKMSKHKGNVFDPWKAINELGADALRWFIYITSTPWTSKRFSMETMAEHHRRAIGTLWNVYSFFTMYANIDGFNPTDYYMEHKARPEIDRWIISRLNRTINDVREGLDKFNTMTASRAIDKLIDELSNWYVRRNRRRFWKGELDSDKISAYLTLYEAITTIIKLMAPFTPFVTEAIYQNLVGSVKEDGLSVHMENYPISDEKLIDQKLEEEMDIVLRVVNLGRAIRSKTNMKIRQPLSKLFYVSSLGKELKEEMLAIIMEELNVKEVEKLDDATKFVQYIIKPNYRVLGPKLGKDIKEVASVLLAIDSQGLASQLRETNSITIEFNDSPMTLLKDELDIQMREKEGYSAESEGRFTVVLDLALTPELINEGIVRELVSKVQTMRKDSGLEVEDRIAVYLDGSDEIIDALKGFEGNFKEETLTKEVNYHKILDGGYTKDWNINNQSLTISIKKA
jgi:isoleucyl-tRNA synthetase